MSNTILHILNKHSIQACDCQYVLVAQAKHVCLVFQACLPCQVCVGVVTEMHSYSYMHFFLTDTSILMGMCQTIPNEVLICKLLVLLIIKACND